jgi:FtsH-binding integral membrane protein
VRPK